MSGEECVAWVTERHGSPSIGHAVGVFVAAVPLSDARVAIGCGSCVTNAVFDLYCELVPPARRESFAAASFGGWEVERRARRDRYGWAEVEGGADEQV